MPKLRFSSFLTSMGCFGIADCIHVSAKHNEALEAIEFTIVGLALIAFCELWLLPLLGLIMVRLRQKRY